MPFSRARDWFVYFLEFQIGQLGCVVLGRRCRPPKASWLRIGNRSQRHGGMRLAGRGRVVAQGEQGQRDRLVDLASNRQVDAGMACQPQGVAIIALQEGHSAFSG